MFSETKSLFKDYGGLIFAGSLLFFFSIFGQSSIFGVYFNDIQKSLDMTKTEISALYATATIVSGFLLIFTGKFIDKHRLRYILAVTIIGLGIGCIALAVSKTAASLLVAFFLLRHFGQALMIHSANTSINRYVEKGKGKAMAIIGIGGPLHVLVIPPLAIWLGQYMEWRTAWIIYGAFILLFLAPYFWIYMRRHQATTHERWLRAQQKKKEERKDAVAREWTRRHVIRDWRFYCLCAILIIPAFFGTIIYLFQIDLSNELGITPITYATGLGFAAFATIIFSFVSGIIIDKYGEKPILISMPIFYTIGILSICCGLGVSFVFAGLFIVNGVAGAMSTCGGPILVNLYGTRNIGAIRALVASINITASAISPVLFGFLMDKGFSLISILAACSFYGIVAWGFALPIFNDIEKSKKKNNEKKLEAEEVKIDSEITL